MKQSNDGESPIMEKFEKKTESKKETLSKHGSKSITSKKRTRRRKSKSNKKEGIITVYVIIYDRYLTLI